MFRALAAWIVALCLAASPAMAEEYFVETQAEYEQVAGSVVAGDTIILADGEWRDFEIVLQGQGREEAPITLTAETMGGVILTGQSNLRIGGSHLVVSGLVFRDGHSPTGEVIAFRVDSETLAFNSRVTQVVIDHFSKPDRFDSDYWVALYGRNNRFDHNHLVGKTNAGVTLAVRLNTEDSRENNHRIDHNYFGPRPNLGSNGGETLRIGTSHFAEFNSNTIVENNIFDRCNGEVEIISVKAGGNLVRGNLFLESRGALTLRHGDGNVVERNVFLGNGVDHTGGIRVINRRQIVRENYMEGLRGDGFASALTVMNGVPNSPANRYVEVQFAEIENNSIHDSDRITFGAGADAERSVAPSDSTFGNNLLAGRAGARFVEVDAPVDGIRFAGNALLAGEAAPELSFAKPADTRLERGANGLLYPVDPALAAVGAPRDLRVLALDEVGVDWYPKPAPEAAFGQSEMRAVPLSSAALIAAIGDTGESDTLLLAPGTYVIDRTIPVERMVSLTGSSNGATIIEFARPTLFELRENGALALHNLVIDGSQAPDSSANAVIRTASVPIRGNLRIALGHVLVRNLDINRDFDVIAFGPSTLADRVDIRNSTFENISGSVVSAIAEADDQGRYNVEYLDISGSTFRNVRGPVAEVYRGGRDESTFGPHILISGSTLEAVGAGAGASLELHGTQRTRILGNHFLGSAPVAITHTVGTPRTVVADNRFQNTPAPAIVERECACAPRVEMRDNSFDGEAGE
ncbi:polysaccharide lyase 6 family protein [Erythrobacter sp. EC-HK427]|uniref:polysaccharide lyase 6 family protein n=1 Tax=Erythrobacter sp. EC-HK427 TaxID=2038396 RepID=UPI0012537318|nr:polysaccharide lyase 6 family protein [Erythrobacter sp. EC-HK427]VVT21110.1 conserved exported hypothetical protein [Erythrobacter sp. EC-HK427]